MNFVGIMFGKNVRFNIFVLFSVIIVIGIGFDNNNFWFKVMGINDYVNLVGIFSGYRFDVFKFGFIVIDEGNLVLKLGENLILLGGIVVIIGEFFSFGGNIIVIVVEGGDFLRIFKFGYVLSLEIFIKDGEDIFNIIVLLLLELLIGGGDIVEVIFIMVNENGDVVLMGLNIMVD